MSKLTRKEKVRRYHAIYNQIYLNPRVHVHEISKNLKFARNTVSGYLDHMYQSEILFGPELRLKYHSGLEKYVHLVKFDDPYSAFDELQRVPQIDYCSMFLGDWNIMYISDEKYDPSHITGFENLLFLGRRGNIYAPNTPLIGWKKAFERMKVQISAFDCNGKIETNMVQEKSPPWDEEEWKLFHEYEYDFRKKVTPILRKHLVSSEKFYQWLETIPQYTSVLTKFYPDGYGNYTHFGFLLKTEFPDSVIDMLSNLPATVVCIQVECGLMTMLSIKSDITFTDLSSTLHRMRTSGMIEGFHQAIGLIHYIGVEEGYAELK
jgi:hypothetical protein